MAAEPAEAAAGGREGKVVRVKGASVLMGASSFRAEAHFLLPDPILRAPLQDGKEEPQERTGQATNESSCSCKDQAS